MLETPDDQAGRLEADRMAVSKQRAEETLVHWETRLEAIEVDLEEGEKREYIPTQTEDSETNYVISFRSPFNACIHLLNDYSNIIIVISIRWF